MVELVYKFDEKSVTHKKKMTFLWSIHLFKYSYTYIHVYIHIRVLHSLCRIDGYSSVHGDGHTPFSTLVVIFSNRLARINTPDAKSMSHRHSHYHSCTATFSIPARPLFVYSYQKTM